MFEQNSGQDNHRSNAGSATKIKQSSNSPEIKQELPTPKIKSEDFHSPRGFSRSRSRSPNGTSRRSRSRSRSPREWKRARRSDSPGGSHDRSRGGITGGRHDTKIRLYVSNIPYEVRWQDLKDIFKQNCPDGVTYVEMYDLPDGKPSGAGVVEVRGREAAEKAIEAMHRFEYKGRQIVVREEREKDRIRHNKGGGDLMMGDGGRGNDGGRGIMGGGGGGMGNMGNMGQGILGNMGGGGGGGMGNMGNMGGGGGGGGGGSGNFSVGNLNLNLSILNTLGIDPANITDQVFVANLDYKVTSRKLKDIFKMAGIIISAEIKMDKEGKSRGMGIVKFDHPMEAVQAVSMFNGQILYERTMSVRMDKMPDTSHVQPQQIPHKLPPGLKGVGMGLGISGAPLQDIGRIANCLSISTLHNIIYGGSGSGNSGGNMGMGNMGGNSMGGNMGGNMGMVNMGNSMGSMDNLAGNMGNSMGMSNMSSLGNMGGGMGNMGMGNSGMGNMGGNSGMGGGMGGGMGNMGGSSMGGNLGMGGMGGGSNMGGMGGGSNMGGMGGMGGSSSNLGMMSSGMGNLGDRNSSMGIGSLGQLGDTMTSLTSSLLGSSGMGGGGSMGRGGGQNRETTSIVVRNLPFSFTWQNLKEKFQDCGDVRFTEIKMENGKSKGWGTVRFMSPEDARRAVNLMNGARIEGRMIDVRLDK